MKFLNRLFLSIEDAGNIDTPGGDSTPTPTPAPASEPAPVANSVSDIINQVRDDFSQQTAEQVPPSAQPEPSNEAQQPEAATQPADTEQPATGQEDASAEESPAATQLQGLARISDLAALPQNEAMPQAVEALQEFASYDPIAEDLLFRAMFEANRKDIHRISLIEMGLPGDLPPAKVAEFVSWVKAGAQALKMPQVGPEFPAPDEDGFVMLPSGAVVDINKPEGLETYEAAKFRYEFKVREEQGKVEQAEAERLEAERVENERRVVAERQVEERQVSFGNSRGEFLSSYIQSKLSNLAEQDSWLGHMVWDHIYNSISLQARQTDAQGNPTTELGRLMRQAKPYIESGAGKAKEYGEKIDVAHRAIANKILDQFNQRILRANKAEIAATVTDPKIPTTAQPITVNTPPPQGMNNLDTYEDIIAAARELDRQNAAANANR